MADTTFDIRIRALVEGIAAITEFANELATTGRQATAIGEKAGVAGDGLAGLSADAISVTGATKGLGASLASTGDKATSTGQKVQATGKDLSNLALDAKVATESAKKLDTALTTSAGSVAAVGDKAKGASDKVDQLSNAKRNSAAAAKNLTASYDPLSSGIDRLIGLAKQAAAAFLALAAVSSLKDAANTAARVETLGVTLAQVGRNAGYTKDELTKYEEELKGLGITTEAARDGMNQMIAAGLQLGPVAGSATDQVAELARTAQNLAVVTGENSSKTLQRLITNIQQLDTEGLRFMGINVNMQAAMEKYAVSVGKASTALTEQERHQAYANAAVDQGRAYMGAYEAAMETTGKKLSSLARYQTEAATSVGNLLLPAYGAVVDATTKFLKNLDELAKSLNTTGEGARNFGNMVRDVFDFAGKVLDIFIGAVKKIAPVLEDTKLKFQQAFADLKTGDVLPTLQKIVDWVVEVGQSMVREIGNAAPSIRLAWDAFTDLAASVGNVLQSLGDLFKSLRLGSEEFGHFKATIQTVGLLIAGLQDGFTFLGALLQTIGAAFLGVAGDILAGWSKVLFFLPQVSKGLQDVATKLHASAQAADDNAAATFKAFADGETAVAKYIKKLAELPDATRASTVSAAEAIAKHNEGLALAAEAVRKLNEAERNGTLSGKALADAVLATRQQVEELRKQYNLAPSEANKFGASLDTLKAKSEEVQNALKGLGLGAQELSKGISDAGSKAVADFTKIAQAGLYTSDQLYAAFRRGIDMAQTLGDLNLFKDAADAAFKAGKLNINDYNSALALTTAQFDELFQKQLKAAKTKADFDALTASVNALGDKVTSSLAKISEATTGAREKMARLSEQTAALAEAGTAVARADLDVTKAALAVQTAKAKVVEAENKFKQDGSELSKAELAAARAQLDLAEQQLELSRKQRAEEVAALDLLTAKQKQLNAEKAVALNPNDGAAKAALDAANKEVEAKQRVVDATREEVAEQQNVVTAAEAAVAVANQMVDSLDKAAASAKKTLSIFESAKYNKEGFLLGADGAVFEAVSHTLEGITAALQQLGLSYEDASAKAREFIDYQHSLQPATGVAKISAAIAQIAEELRINKAEADAVNRTYAYAKELIDRMASGTLEVGQNSEYVALAVQQSGQQMRDLAAAAGDAGAAVRAIRADAQSVAQAARDAASAFVGSAASIHEELLSATGQEEEASASRFETRKRELQTEYELLKVKIQIAIATAKAAGVSTDGLDQSLIDADLAQARALKDLADLEALEKQKIVARKAEEQRQRQAAADKAAKDAQEAKDADARRAASDAAAHDQRVRNERDLQALRRQGESDLLNRAAPSTPLGDRLLRQVNQANNFGTPISSSASQAAADRSPSRVVQINFTNDQGASIPVTVAEDYIEPLLAMLQRAKKASI